MNKIIIVIFTLLVFSSAIYSGDNCIAEEKDAVQTESDSSHYLIGANDLLNIFVWRETDLTQEITVMPDGRITFPMISEIMAKGLTLTELEEIISEKLRDYISNPEVTVMLIESRSRMIYIIGKVNNPGAYQLQSDMTLLQALSTAGGLTEWAETKNIIVVRREEGKEVIYHFNYQEFISGKNLRQNIALEPNDTIVVP